MSSSVKGSMREPNDRPAPSLRHWLNQRTDSERATLARLWFLPVTEQSTPTALAEAILRPEVADRLVALLGPRERAALRMIQQEGGMIPAARLEREFGAIR